MKNVDCPLRYEEGWKSAALTPPGSEKLWDPTKYHEEWENVACGIKIGMVGNLGGRMSTESIHVFAPSTLRTQKGIHIGSTEQEVMKAYEAGWNKQDDWEGKAFLVGSIDKGLIFYFENGRVVEILFQGRAD